MIGSPFRAQAEGPKRLGAFGLELSARFTQNVAELPSIGIFMSTDTLEQTLLSLPEADRARLAKLLIRSLDDDLGEDVDEAAIAHEWQVVVRRRADELRSGAVESVSGEQVAAEVRRLLR